MACPANSQSPPEFLMLVQAPRSFEATEKDYKMLSEKKQTVENDKAKILKVLPPSASATVRTI